MSFLDNLENSLKSLESQDERDGSVARRREADRTATLAAAPWADKLKNSGYTKTLMKHATAAGYKLRTKVYLGWVGSALKLEAREQKLELYPAPDGIDAVFLDNGKETRRKKIDLEGDPDDLVREWLAPLARPLS
jgi:hypothetical protein